MASAKAAVEKLQSEGKTEEAAAYASKIKEYVDKNKEALTTAAKGDMTVADLVNGIANLPASVQQGAAAAKAAVNAAIFKDYICDVGQYLADADAAGKAAKQAAETKIKEDAAAVKAHAEAAKKAAEAHAAAKVEEGKQKIRDAANKKVNEALNEVLGK